MSRIAYCVLKRSGIAARNGEIIRRLEVEK